MTIYKAQAVTVDRAYVLGDGLNAESGYTALIRGRDQNHLYTPQDQGIDHHGAEPDALATKIRRFDIYTPDPISPRPRRTAPEAEVDLGMDFGM